MNQDRLNEMLDVAARLSPKSLTVVVEENGVDLVNTRFPFTLVRTVLKFAGNFSSIASKYAPGMSESDLKELIRSINVDAILADLSSGGVTLPYTLADVRDAQGHHAFAVLE